MTAAESMLDQADKELCEQFPVEITHDETKLEFSAIIEDPQSGGGGDGVGLRLGEEDFIAIVARQNQFNRLPIVGESLLRAGRRFEIAAVRPAEGGHLVAFICSQPPS